MVCPYCGGVTRVNESRPVNDQVIRRRVCLSCKTYFYTGESLLKYDTGYDLFAAWRKNRKGKKND